MPPSLPRKWPDLRLAVVAIAVWLIQALSQVSRGGVDQPQANAESFAPTWWRAAFVQATTGLPGVGGQLLPGLTLGDTSGVSDGLNAAMRAASLTHLTAVSGANCAIVTAAVIALAGTLGLPRWARGLVGILALAGFVLMVGFQPSVLRAAVMALVVIVALMGSRPHAGIPVLALGVMVLLLVFPQWALAPGFVLSVVATASLLVLAPALALRWSPRLGKRWALVLAVPVAAQLACQPLIILLSPTWPTYGVIANVLAEPLAPLATILGMLTFLAAPLMPPFAAGLAWCGWLPAQIIGTIAMTTQRLPLTSLPWLGGIPGFVAAAFASAACVAVLLRGRGRARRRAALVLVMTWGLSLAIAVSGAIRTNLTLPREWSIAACDVGQGDALIIRGVDAQGHSHAVLVDTGRHEGPLRHCLDTLGIEVLDRVILTHFDIDHAGGVAAVYGRTSRVLISAPQRDRDVWVIRDLAAHGIAVDRARAGQHFWVGDARIEIIWPRPENPDMQGGNPGSVSLLCRTRGLTAAFLADLGAEAQDRLLSEYPGLAAVDVLKVAHHGSADQSPALTARLHPRIALISVGRDNGYGHPTRSALTLLGRWGTRVDRTDREGLILVSIAREGLSVWSEKTDTGPD